MNDLMRAVSKVRRFQLDMAGTGLTISNRNGIVTGVRFPFRVTLRRLDLEDAFYQVREPRRSLRC